MDPKDIADINYRDLNHVVMNTNRQFLLKYHNLTMDNWTSYFSIDIR